MNMELPTGDMVLDFKSEDIMEEYDQIMSDLGDFYNIDWVENKPKIHFLESRQQIDAIWKNPTNRSVVGWISSSNGDVYVLKNEKMATESDHKTRSYDEYYSLIKHELSHSFEKMVAEDTKIFPKWLWEGVAIYTSGQLKGRKMPEVFTTFLDFFDTQGFVSGVYKESGFVVEILIKKFGKEKIISLIKRLKECKNRDDFSNLFKEIYGVELSYESLNELKNKND